MVNETKNTSNGSRGAEAATDSAQHHAGNAAHALDAKLSGPLAPLETALDGVFGDKAAVQLPKNIKDLLVKIAPWLSLLAGILGILAAISLWRSAHYINGLTEYSRNLSEAFGVSAPDPQLGLMFWLSIIMTLVFAVLALLAFPGLRAKKKIGWNLMFYSMLANVAYGVVSLFYDGGGVGSLLSAVIMSVIGFFILFQIRSHYAAAHSTQHNKAV